MELKPLKIKETIDPTEDKSILKILVLGVLFLSSLALALFSFGMFFLTGNSVFLVCALVGSVGWIIHSILLFYIVKGRVKIGAFVLLASGMVGFGMYYFSESWTLLGSIGTALFTLGTLMISARARILARTLSEPRPAFFAKETVASLASMIALASIFGGAAYFFEAEKGDDAMAQKMLYQGLSLVQPITSISYPDLDFKSTVGDFYKKIAEPKLRKIEPNILSKFGYDAETHFLQLPTTKKTEIINLYADELRKEDEKKFGLLNPTVEIRLEIWNKVRIYVKSFLPWQKNIFWIIICLLFFFFVKGILFLCYKGIEFGVFLFIKFFVLTGFVEEQKEESLHTKYIV